MSSTGKTKGWRLLFALILAPMVLAVVYYTIFAVDRYESSAMVVVRQDGNDSAANLNGLSALLTGASSASREETLYLREYITSYDMMQLLEERLQWKEHYQQQRKDPFFWLMKDAPREDQLKFYLRMVSANFDETTGLLHIRVQALDPQMAKNMVGVILEAGEHFVNEVSHRIAREQMAFAQSELDKAQANYSVRKTALLAFQNTNKVLDGQTNAQSRAGIISGLEAEYSKQQALITELQYRLRADSPQVQQLRLRVNSLRTQLDREKALLVSAPDGVQANVVASLYQQLMLDAGIAEDSYKTATAALDNARIEASKKIRTLVTVTTPNLPDLALYPERLYDLASIFLGLLLLYGITRFIIASIEDHRD